MVILSGAAEIPVTSLVFSHSVETVTCDSNDNSETISIKSKEDLSYIASSSSCSKMDVDANIVQTPIIDASSHDIAAVVLASQKSADSPLSGGDSVSSQDKTVSDFSETARDTVRTVADDGDTDIVKQDEIVADSVVVVSTTTDNLSQSLDNNGRVLEPVANRPSSVNGLSSIEAESLRLTASSLDRVSSIQSLTSPVHSMRTPVTQNDPLGLFSDPLATVSTADHDVQSPTFDAVLHSDASGQVSSSDASSPCSIQDVGGSLVDTFTQPSLGGQSFDGAAADTTSMPPPATTPHRVKSAATREVVGTAMRSYAFRFASKYREMKQTITTTSTTKSGSVSSGSINSINSVGAEQQASNPLPSVEATDKSVRRASAYEQGERLTTSDGATDIRSRLSVPGLYAPLGENCSLLVRLPLWKIENFNILYQILFICSNIFFFFST